MTRRYINNNDHYTGNKLDSPEFVDVSGVMVFKLDSLLPMYHLGELKI